VEALRIGVSLEDPKEAGCNLTASGWLLERAVLRPGKFSELIAYLKQLSALLLLVRTMAGITSFWDETLAALLGV